MAVVVSNSSEILLLKYMLNNTAASDVVLHLYNTNITPSENDTLATYSPYEPTDGAYTAATLNGASWTFGTVGGVSAATYARQYFTFSSSASIYGIYFTNNAEDALLMSQRFDVAPYNIVSSGGQIGIDPRIELS